MKYRICYKKKDALIFISHLDMQNLLQRAFTRAKLDLMFSEGFNPHPKLSYTPPLSLFVSSDEEYVDVELGGGYSANEVCDMLKKQMPQGLVINSVEECLPSSTSLSKLADWALYEIRLCAEEMNDEEKETFCRKTEELFSKKEVTVNKISKGKPVEKNIAPQISAVKCNVNTSGEIVIRCVLSMKNESLLNPAVFISAITQKFEAAKKISVISINKSKTFINA